jgi:Fe-S-cluster containining protein
MGLVHQIKERLNVFEFILLNKYSGEETKVTIDSDKCGLFIDRSSITNLSEACPFLRWGTEQQNAFCTVHLTRPEICRDFGCWRILICDPSGKRVGRIFRTRTLLSEHPSLITLWEGCSEVHREPDDGKWEERVVEILTSAGYKVRK